MAKNVVVRCALYPTTSSSCRVVEEDAQRVKEESYNKRIKVTPTLPGRDKVTLVSSDNMWVSLLKGCAQPECTKCQRMCELETPPQGFGPNEEFAFLMNVLQKLSAVERRWLLHQKRPVLQAQATETDGDVRPMRLKERHKKALQELIDLIGDNASKSPKPHGAIKLPWKGKARPHAKPKFSLVGWSEDAIKKFLSSNLIDYATGSIAITSNQELAASWMPICVVAGSAKQLRVCIGFSRLKTYLRDGSCRYHYPCDLLRKVKKVMRMGVKLDLSNAYKYLSIDEEDTKYLGVMLETIAFKWLIYALGISTAPKDFCAQIEAAITRALNKCDLRRKEDTNAINYVDDIAVAAASADALIEVLRAIILELIADGWWLSSAKCFIRPVQRLNFLGILVAFDLQKCIVLPAKAKQLRAMMEAMKDVSEFESQIEMLQSFCGLTTFVGMVAPAILLVRRPLYGFLQSLRKLEEQHLAKDRANLWMQVIDLVQAAIETIDFIASNPDLLWGVDNNSLGQEDRCNILLTTDASIAFGGVFIRVFNEMVYDLCYSSSIAPEFHEEGSAIRELAVCVKALWNLPMALKYRAVITINIDAGSAISMASRWRSKVELARGLLIALSVIQMYAQCDLRFVWTDREAGLIPLVDGLSKHVDTGAVHWKVVEKEESKVAYALTDQDVSLIEDSMGPIDIDLFASGDIKKPVMFGARMPPEKWLPPKAGQVTSYEQLLWLGDARCYVKDLDILSRMGNHVLVYPPFFYLDKCARGVLKAQEINISFVVPSKARIWTSWLDEVVWNELHKRTMHSIELPSVPGRSPLKVLIFGRRLFAPIRNVDITRLLMCCGDVPYNPGPPKWPTLPHNHGLQLLIQNVCPPCITRVCESQTRHEDLLVSRIPEIAITEAANLSGEISMDTWLELMLEYLSIDAKVGPPPIQGMCKELRSERKLLCARRLALRHSKNLENLRATVVRVQRFSAFKGIDQVRASEANLQIIVESYVSMRLNDKERVELGWKHCEADTVEKEIGSWKAFCVEFGFVSLNTHSLFGPGVARLLKNKGSRARSTASLHLPIHGARVLVVQARLSHDIIDNVVFSRMLLFCCLTGMRGCSARMTKWDMIHPVRNGIIFSFYYRPKVSEEDKEATIMKYPHIFPSGSILLLKLLDEMQPQRSEYLFPLINVVKYRKWIQIHFPVPEESSKIHKRWVVGTHSPRPAFTTELDYIPNVPKDILDLLQWWKRSPSSASYYKGIDFEQAMEFTKSIGTRDWIHFAPGCHVVRKTNVELPVRAPDAVIKVDGDAVSPAEINFDELLQKEEGREVEYYTVGEDDESSDGDSDDGEESEEEDVDEGQSALKVGKEAWLAMGPRCPSIRVRILTLPDQDHQYCVVQKVRDRALIPVSVGRLYMGSELDTPEESVFAFVWTEEAIEASNWEYKCGLEELEENASDGEKVVFA